MSSIKILPIVLIGAIFLTIIVVRGLYSWPPLLLLFLLVLSVAALLLFLKPPLGIALFLMLRIVVDAFGEFPMLTIDNYPLDLTLTPTQFMALVFLILAILFLFTRLRQIVQIPLLFPIGLFLILSSFSIFRIEEYRLLALDEILRLSEIFLVFIVTYLSFAQKDDVLVIVRALVIATIFPILLALWQYWQGVNLFPVTNFEVRVFGTFAHPNVLALFLSFVILQLLIFRATTTHLAYKIAYLMVIFLALITLLLTFGRTAWVGLMVGILLLAFLKFRYWFLLIPILVSLIISFVPAISQRFADLQYWTPHTNTLIWRVELWQNMAQKVLVKPIFGHALGQFEVVARQIMGQAFSLETIHPHNDYLEIAFESGLPGLIAYLFLIGLVLSTALKAYQKTNDPLTQNIALLVTSGLGSGLIMGLTSNFLSHTPLQWCIWSVIAALYWLTNQEIQIIKKRP